STRTFPEERSLIQEMTMAQTMTETQLVLHFAEGVPPELWKTDFDHPSLTQQRLRAVRGKDPGAHAASGTFDWSVAVKVLMVYLLRCAAWGLRHGDGEAGAGGAAPEAFPRLEGGPGSPAATLNFAMSKRNQWICDVFGSVGGRPILSRLVNRSNIDLKRKNEP